MQIFAISALINALVAIALGLFVIFYNPRDKKNRLYFLMGLAIAFWSIGYWRWQSSNDAATALFWTRILSMGSTMIPVFYFHWVVAILERDKKEKIAIFLNYIFAGIILFFSFSPLFIEGVRPKMFFNFWPDPGIFYHLYLAYVYCILVTYSIFLLLMDYRNAFGEKKAQIIYVIIGSVVGFGGGLFNFFLWYDIPIPPYGNFLVALYPFFLGYAVIKYRLFDVKIVVTEILVFLLWIFLLVKTLLSNSTQDLLINVGILSAVAIIGILLIRGIIKDVKQKEQIEKMANDIARAYEVEKNANEELKQIDQVKDQFLMITQHDLRRPLVSVKWFLDLLISGQLGKQNKTALEGANRTQTTIEESIEQVNNFLDIAQFQMGKNGVQLKPGVDLSRILESIVAKSKPQADAKAIYLNFEKPQEPVVIEADAIKLKASLSNIVDNALKYTEKGGVTVALAPNPKPQTPIPNQTPNPNSQKSIALITVKDTGIGVAPDKIKTLFNSQFERSEQAQKMTSFGRGIGLYLSSNIIKAHNGKIWVKSQGLDKGSTFCIELPA